MRKASNKASKNKESLLRNEIGKYALTKATSIDSFTKKDLEEELIEK